MINLYMEPLGLEEFEVFLKEQTGINSHYSAVELSPTNRTDSDASNADIMKFLKDRGRDFVTLDSSKISDIEKAAAEEYQRRIEIELKRMARSAGKAAGLSGRKLTAHVASTASGMRFKPDEKWARQTQAAMMKRAMEAYMRAVDANIEGQVASGGLAQLSEAYAEYKRRTFGFDTPIGKATGQLLENLDTSISSKNIKLIRKK